ncbi:DUF2165 family protein [Pseudohaliea sp.]|uniref:DUF2165 family protein n=1 Tax=Pseudohaliea sp. TaxID=2740289 RepID=UPI0032EC41F3
MLRGTQIALIAAVCLWGLFSALGNILDWQGTLGAVTTVATMSTWEGGGRDWRAIGSPVFISTASSGIVAFKLLSALLCGLGATRMVRERGAPVEGFAAAKATALSGCGVAMLGLFLGWIVLGEQWFELWRSPELGAAGDAAFRYGGFIGIIALFVAMGD